MDGEGEREPGDVLLEKVAFLELEVTGERSERTAAGDTVVRIDLVLGERDEDGQRSPDHEWGAFGLIFCMAVVSFHSAEPGSADEPAYRHDDEFGVADLFDHLRYEEGNLHFRCAQLRGRRMDTDIVVRRDGSVTLAARNRRQTPADWVRMVRGSRRRSG